ncbi:unnamed protein product, partial [marine sediment metagenome]
MIIKKALLLLLTFIIILAIGIGGYLSITQQTEKKLTELETEVKTIGETKQVVKEEEEQEEVISPSPRTIILPNQPKVEQNSSFSLRTNKETYIIGESFSLDVIVKSPGVVIDGAEFVLNYDPQVIEVGELILGSFFSLYPQKKVDPEKGTIKVVALQKTGENKELYEEIVVSLPITGLKKGRVDFTFDQT